MRDKQKRRERRNRIFLIVGSTVAIIAIFGAVGLVLINANKRVKEKNGQLRLTNIKPQIYEVFVITKLNKLFRILPTRAEGLASFS